ncbi:legumain-like isoform X2 [Onychostoma macrolepis]|uniref:legumain-like isoform X2 n=1 Tax=Onychostoma macrolepis TaxID=369639 RepID=UPI00272C451E|nr:legumain-like isoform X2 [Onychostoma macrolepis]
MENYRHQADVCHAYQIVHQNGIPDEQIVVMINPHPGKIINKPNGLDVYPGVPKDYTGEDVTPQNFLAALKGDRRAMKKRNPKVITSGGNDTIFIYLTDHGGSGIFCFPNDILHASDLIETIKEMARNNKFAKMVIYMESCHSGSMFTKLPNNVHVYAVTAARADEASYACYFDSERETFLSDEFSAHWMYYTETNDLDNKTFGDQFGYLQEMMMSSHSCRFGDMTMGGHPISEFVNNTPQRVRSETRALGFAPTHLTSNHDVPFKILEHRIKTETDAGRKQHLKRKYEALHKTKAKIDGDVEAISKHFKCDDLDEDYSKMDLHAFKTVAEHFRATCFDWHKEECFTQFHIALPHMHAFARLCACGVESERIIEVITKVSRKSSRKLQQGYKHP